MKQNNRYVIKSNDGKYFVVKTEYNSQGYRYGYQPSVTYLWIDNIEQADVYTREHCQEYTKQFPDNSCRIVQILRTEIQ